jgi:hypothetical protein
MRFGRTILALVLVLPVALLPVAGASAVEPVAATAVEISAPGAPHDCCPTADVPCTKGMQDCAGMATCATTTVTWLVDASQWLDYAPPSASRMVASTDDALRAHQGDPPLRPPRA